MEQWLDIIGYENKYQVSNYGNIRALKYNGSNKTKNMCPLNNGNGYLHIGLRLPKQKRQLFYVHRLVYCTFNSIKYDTKLQIDHIDTNRSNNNLDNLRLVTCSLNAYNPLTVKHRKFIHRTKEGRPCIAFCNGSLVKQFNSLSEAAEYFNCSRAAIFRCCNGLLTFLQSKYRIEYL